MVARAFRLHDKSQDKILIANDQRGMRLMQKREFEQQNDLQFEQLKFKTKSKRNKAF